MCKIVVRSALPFLFLFSVFCLFFFLGGGGLHGIPAILIMPNAWRSRKYRNVKNLP